MNNIPDPERPTGDPRTKSMRNEGWAIETGDYARVGPHEGGTRRKGCMAFLGEAKGVSSPFKISSSLTPNKEGQRLRLLLCFRSDAADTGVSAFSRVRADHYLKLFGDILRLTTAGLKLAGILLAKKTWRKGKRFWFFFIATFDPKIPNTKIPTQTLKIFLSLNNEPPSWEDSCLLGIISRKQIRIHKRHREGEWGHQLFEPSLLATPLAYEHSSSVIYAGCFRVFIRKFSVSDNGKYFFSFLNCRPCIWRKIGLMLHF